MPNCTVCGVEIAEGYWPKELPRPERVYDHCALHWLSCCSWGKTDFSALPVEEFQGRYILGSSFGGENYEGSPWPVGAGGCVFERCVFVNCEPPPRSTLLGCDQRRYKAQADGQDWYLDHADAPVRPLDKDLFKNEKWSSDPADIPQEPRKPGVSAAEVVFDPVTGAETKLAGEVK